MKWHVYLLRLSNGTIYVGSTNNLNRRWAEHTTGRGSFSCRKSKPAELIYSETWPDRTSAVRRERQIKRWSRAKKLALATGQIEQLHRLAKSSGQKF